ncbi:hypothetical protein ACKKBG_A32135 [Auxenochlorella protothecoides x Auxenochlorella symbiontica]
MSWLARHAARYINQPGVTVRQCPPSRDLAPLAAAAPSLGSFLESMRALVPSLADMGLLAVPKRKVSPHRRGNRNSTKFIRFVPVAAQCSRCKRVFQQHQHPRKCEEEACPAFALRQMPK